MEEFTTILTGISDRDGIDFVLVFVKTKAEIDHFVPAIHKKLEGDGIIWFSYPKKSSKKIQRGNQPGCGVEHHAETES